jgi:hypothetical protein
LSPYFFSSLLSVLRADDKDYTGDLWENVCLYMLGCRFGVAVFEEIDQREFNPNVAFELGFMTAHGKRCPLLKDQRKPLRIKRSHLRTPRWRASTLAGVTCHPLLPATSAVFRSGRGAADEFCTIVASFN